jgi:hypothetical protein
MELEHARGAPIHLHFITQVYTTQSEASKIASLLEPYAPYIASLTARDLSSAELFHTLFSVVASHVTPGALKSVAFAGIWRRDPEQDIIPWPATFFPGLVNLDLCSIGYPDCPTQPQILQILSSSPALRTLRLRMMTILPDQAEPAPTSVHLPRLELLDLVDMVVPGLLLLLPILFPGTLELDVRLSTWDDPKFVTAVQHFFQRSNVKYLSLYCCKCLDGPRDQSSVHEYDQYVPNLSVLFLDLSWDSYWERLDGLFSSTDKSYSKSVARRPSLRKCA